MTTSRHPWIDLSEFPLIKEVVPDQFTDEDVYAFFKAIEVLILEQHAPYAVVMGAASHTAVFSIAHRRAAAELEEKIAPVEKVYNAGTGYVTRSSIQRGILTAVFWLRPPAYPYRVFDDMNEAEEWARTQLARVARAAKSA